MLSCHGVTVKEAHRASFFILRRVFLNGARTPHHLSKMPVLRLCRYTAAVAASGECDKRERDKRALVMEPVWKQYLTGAGKRTWGSGLTMTTLSPDQRLHDLIDALNRLDSMGYERSATQKLFHKAFIVAVLKQIYGRDIHRHVGALMKRFDVNEIRPDVIVCAIRRVGKTFAVALFAAAYVLTQPGVILNIYSTCKRTARKLQALIWKIVTKLAGTPHVIQNYNQEELVVRCHGTTSTINSLPSSVEVRSFLFHRPLPPTLSPLLFALVPPPPHKHIAKCDVLKQRQGTSRVY